MLVDADFARWIVTGRPRAGDTIDGRTEQARFADYERLVMSRTNAVVGPAAGCSCRGPVRWGRRRGVPSASSRRALPPLGRATGCAWCGSPDRRRCAGPTSTSCVVVGDGRPALLYVGDALTPRHVTLVLPASGEGVLDVYDPASGAVTALDEDRYAARRLGLAGWPMPWVLVQPDGRPRDDRCRDPPGRAGRGAGQLQVPGHPGRGDGGGVAALVHDRVVPRAEQGQVRQVGRAAVAPVPDVMCVAPGWGPRAAGEGAAPGPGSTAPAPVSGWPAGRSGPGRAPRPWTRGRPG